MCSPNLLRLTAMRKQDGQRPGQFPLRYAQLEEAAEIWPIDRKKQKKKTEININTTYLVHTCTWAQLHTQTHTHTVLDDKYTTVHDLLSST